MTALLLDTNYFWLPKEIRQSCERLCREGKIRILFSAVVIAERARQLTQSEHNGKAKGEKVVLGNRARDFIRYIRQLETDIGEVVISFEIEDAQALGKLWDKWLSLQPEFEWKQKPIRPLELKEDTQAYWIWTNHKMDWLIAATAQRTGWTVVTSDNDPPYKEVKRMTMDEFRLMCEGNGTPSEIHHPA